MPARRSTKPAARRTTGARPSARHQTDIVRELTTLNSQLQSKVQHLQEQTETLAHRVAEQTRQLQTALDGAGAGTWFADLRSNTLQWDERTCAMFGVENCTEPFDPTFPGVHSDDRERLQERFRQLQTPGDDLWNMTFRVHRPGGTDVWVHGVGRVDRDADGHPVTFYGINLDVTEQRRTEEDLRAAQLQQSEAAAMVERVLGGAAEGILAATEAGIIERANAALEAMFGYEPGELAGQPLELLVPEDRRTRHAVNHAAFWAAPRARPMGQSLDLVGRRKDGSTFPIEVSVTPVKGPSGNRALAFVSDITDRKRNEDALRRNNTTLQAQADQLRQRAEQLRRLASELTISEQQTREQLAKVVHDHLQQVLFSAKLRADRLATARAGSPQTPGLANRLRDDLEAAVAAARSLSVELFPPTLHQDGLPAALNWLATWMEEKYGLSVDVTADPHATLDQKDLRTLAFESVRELLFNVVKHAEVKHAVVSLRCRSDEELEITVSDEGVGFEPSVVLTAHDHPPGWGLFSLRERVDLLGGRLDLQSAPGRGTRFTIVIPRAKPGDGGARRALRILLADDHVVARAGLREILGERCEFEIVGEATTGAEAISMAESLRPDAIIMDVVMPGVDGIEATRRIHEVLPAIRIIGLSTQERSEGRHAIELAGAIDYFTKGDDAHLLIDRLLTLHATREVPIQ